MKFLIVLVAILVSLVQAKPSFLENGYIVQAPNQVYSYTSRRVFPTAFHAYQQPVAFHYPQPQQLYQSPFFIQNEIPRQQFITYPQPAYYPTYHPAFIQQQPPISQQHPIYIQQQYPSLIGGGGIGPAGIPAGIPGGIPGGLPGLIPVNPPQQAPGIGGTTGIPAGAEVDEDTVSVEAARSNFRNDDELQNRASARIGSQSTTEAPTSSSSPSTTSPSSTTSNRAAPTVRQVSSNPNAGNFNFKAIPQIRNEQFLGVPAVLPRH